MQAPPAQTEAAHCIQARRNRWSPVDKRQNIFTDILPSPADFHSICPEITMTWTNEHIRRKLHQNILRCDFLSFPVAVVSFLDRNMSSAWGKNGVRQWIKDRGYVKTSKFQPVAVDNNSTLASLQLSVTASWHISFHRTLYWNKTADFQEFNDDDELESNYMTS